MWKSILKNVISITWSVIDKVSFQTETDIESAEGNTVQGFTPWFKVLICKQRGKEVGVDSQRCNLGVSWNKKSPVSLFVHAEPSGPISKQNKTNFV